MRKILTFIMIACLTICMSACGTKYTCKSCDKTTSNIYYDVNNKPSLCEDCAKEYWTPGMDYKDYKVK